MHIRLKSGLTFNNPEEMLKMKFEAWPWKNYDGNRPHDSNAITNGDIDRVYRLGSRTPYEAYQTLISKSGQEINAILKDIPNTPLEEIDLTSVEANLRKIFNIILSQKHIKLAGATKLLHPFRPALIPVLDSVVAQYYLYATSFSDETRFRALKVHKEWGSYILDLMLLIQEDVLPIRSQIDQILSRATGESYQGASRIRVVESLIWFYYARGIATN